MREDMFKVIVERPRSGRSWAAKTKLRYLKPDDERTRMSGKRLAIEIGRRKWLNENLAPLKRYLQKQLGRKWDDIFSDICRHLDTGSTVKMHVREHLDDFVMRKVRIDEDGMYWGSGYWGGLYRPDWWRAAYYVDPADGRLKETRALRAKLGLVSPLERRRQKYKCKRTLPGSFRRLSGTQFLVKCGGLWYRFELSNPPQSPSGFAYTDCQIREELQRYTAQPNPDWAVVRKQQLSRKALRSYGLKNGDCDE